MGLDLLDLLQLLQLLPPQVRPVAIRGRLRPPPLAAIHGLVPKRRNRVSRNSKPSHKRSSKPSHKRSSKHSHKRSSKHSHKRSSKHRRCS